MNHPRKWLRPVYNCSTELLSLRTAMASTSPDNGLCCLLNFLFLFLLMSLPLKTQSLSFNFSDFDQNNPGVKFQGSATTSSSQLQLTVNQQDTSVQTNAGRALYPTAMQLWDASTKRLTDFTTNFTFSTPLASTSASHGIGDGLTFLLVPENTTIPNDAYGGCLAMFSQINGTCVQNQTIVAIEFDTFTNKWDPSPNDHIGIDVNSIQSAAYVNVSASLTNITAQAFISYNSASKNLSVSLTMNSIPYSVSHVIDLSTITILPERVQVGFSASTGSGVELHKIHAWSFNSSLKESVSPSPSPPLQQGGTEGRPPTNKGGNKKGLVAGIAVGIFLIIIFGIVISWLRLQRNSPTEGSVEDDQFDIDEDFNKETGPRKFAYFELSQATNNFATEGKLGEGGFGGVYKGFLTVPEKREIAVKKIKSGSNQGKKEYISEVKIISRLRHRNLVQLLGWCHDHGDLLLVYEFMPNGSLDFHLFGNKLLLPWSIRHKIALGLASALLYLHEEWEQCVVHRDIKSSNVMLDLNFNAKLGDFGLARFADHDIGLQTTVPAGTPGYLAPECLMTGKASKESDVYSFGIVALEIACGRKVIEVKEEDGKVELVKWVWDLCGKGLILEAVDRRLEEEFDKQQAKCLMVVGLWCCHPDVSYRPSIRQATAALNLETLLPTLPPQLPVPIYVSPGMKMSLLSSFPSSSMTEGNHGHTSTSNMSTSTTNSSLQSAKSTSSTHPLLGTE